MSARPESLRPDGSTWDRIAHEAPPWYLGRGRGGWAGSPSFTRSAPDRLRDDLGIELGIEEHAGTFDDWEDGVPSARPTLRPEAAAETTPERPHNWMDEAACASAVGADFFPERGHADTPEVARAIALCEQCGVSKQCGDRARTLDDTGGGIWAGVAYNGASLPMAPQQAAALQAVVEAEARAERWARRVAERERRAQHLRLSRLNRLVRAQMATVADCHESAKAEAGLVGYRGAAGTIKLAILTRSA